MRVLACLCYSTGALELTCLQLDEDTPLADDKVQCFFQHAGADMPAHVAQCPVAAVAPFSNEALRLQLVPT